MPPVPHVLKGIKSSLRKGDTDALAVFLESLEAMVPEARGPLLLRESVLPHPTRTDRVAELVPKLRAAVDLLYSSGRAPLLTGEMQNLLAAIEDISQRIVAIRAWQGRSQLRSLSPTTRIMLASQFIEEVHFASQKQVEQSFQSGEVDFSLLTSSLVPLTTDPNTRISLSAAIENSVDVTEVVIRQALHDARREGFGRRQTVESSPVSSAETTFYSSYWVVLHWLWECVVFWNWKVERSDLSVSYQPVGDQLLNLAAASRRRTTYRAGNSMQAFAALQSQFSDSAAVVEELARSLPDLFPGDLWDCTLDVDSLQKACASPFNLIMTELEVEGSFGKSLVERLELNFGGVRIGWNTWLKCLSALKVIAGAIEIKHRPRDESERPLIVRVNRMEVSRLLSTALGIPVRDCRVAVQYLSLDPTIQKRTIWDQPLLPLDREELLILPQFVNSIDPMFALDRLILGHGDGDFSPRGDELEKWASRLFSAYSNARTACGQSISTGDGGQLEFDLVVWWQEHLFLIEAKCIREPYSPSDWYSARETLNKSVAQLIARREYATQQWDRMVDQFDSLRLPREAPSLEAVVCISLTNIFAFSGLQTDDVLLVDALSLDQYLNNPKYGARSFHGQSFEYIRTGAVRDGDASAVGLAEYLKNPVPVRYMQSGTDVTMTALPRLSEVSAPLHYATVSHAKLPGY